MSVASPKMLWLLFLVPLAVWGYRRLLEGQARRRARYASEGLVVANPSERLGRRRHLPFAFFVSALTLLLVGAARPHGSFGIPRREGTVILAFDVSNSMLADDLEPSRMEAARTAAKVFVADQPDSILIGVVAFGEGGFIAQTPTDSRPDVEAAIDRLSVEGGTAIGAGIFSSLTAISGEPLVLDEEQLDDDLADVDIGYYPSAAIILLSDGEDTGGPDPIQLAEIASVAGVDIHTIGLGSPEGTTVEIDGFTVATTLDEELLTEIAESTDGAYHLAEDTESLTDVYDSIDLEMVSRSEPRELTAVFTGTGMAALTIGALLSMRWFGRVG